MVRDLRDTSQRLRKIASEHEHPGALFRMGEMASQSGEEIEAEKWFGKAAEKGVAAAWTSLGRLQQQRGDTTKAIALFKKGVELGMFLDIGTCGSRARYFSFLPSTVKLNAPNSSISLRPNLKPVANQVFTHR